MIFGKDNKSYKDPLAALSKTVPIKALVEVAVESSKHGKILVESLNDLCSKIPSKPD
jgi:hypothetical protein